MRTRVAARRTWSPRCRDPEWEGAGSAGAEGLVAGTREVRRPASTQGPQGFPRGPPPRPPPPTAALGLGSRSVLGLQVSAFGAREILR